MPRPDLQTTRIEDEAAGAVIYRLEGVLGDAPQCRELLDAVRGVLNDRRERIVFNVTGLQFMSSAGVGIVASCFTSARKAGRSFALVGVRSNVRRVLEICGLLPLIPTFGSEAEALRDGAE